MSKDLNLGKRIAWLRTNRGLEQAEVAKAMGFVYGSYQKYEYGYPPNRRNLEAIIRYYKCSKSWLVTGEGVPYPDRPEERPADAQPIVNNIVHMNPETRILEEAVAEAGVTLNERQRLALLEIIRGELNRVEGKITNLIRVFKTEGGNDG